MINYSKLPIPLQLAFIAGSVIVGAVVGMIIGCVAVHHFFPGARPALPMEKYAFNRTNLVLALLFGTVITNLFFSLHKISSEKMRRLEASSA